MTIQAIETRYAGCRFRSRLEARWAVFFDHLGIRWEYESQGYELSSGRYLPDFLLHGLRGDADTHGELWFEVKPDINPADGDDERWYELAIATRRPVVVAWGMPRPDRDAVPANPNGWMEIYFFPAGDCECAWDNYRLFVKCPRCRALGICFSGWLDRLGCGCFNDRADGSSHADLLKAYSAARSARFEHGEAG